MYIMKGGGAAGKKLPLLVNDMYVYVYNKGGGAAGKKLSLLLNMRRLLCNHGGAPQAKNYHS